MPIRLTQQKPTQTMLRKQVPICINRSIQYSKCSNTSHSISSFSCNMGWQAERSLEGCSKAQGSECSGRFGALLMLTRPQEGSAGTRSSFLCTTHLWSGWWQPGTEQSKGSPAGGGLAPGQSPAGRQSLGRSGTGTGERKHLVRKHRHQTYKHLYHQP